MPDFKSNSSFKINDPNGASNLRWTNDGHLQIPVERLIELSGLDINDQIFVADANEALDNSGNLKENYLEEEIEVDIALDTDEIPITTRTFKFYYRYVEEERRYDDYLIVNVALATGEDFCNNLNQLEYRTLYVAQSDLNETQKSLLVNQGKVFNETIYSTDRGQIWDGKLNNGQEARYVLFPSSTEFESLSKKYYPIFASKPGLNDDPNEGRRYQFSEAQNSCPVRPQVTEVQLFISPNLLNTDRTKEAICDGATTTQPGLSQRTQITAYIQGDSSTISGKTLFQEDGLNPIDPRVFNISSAYGLTQANIVRLVGENESYYLLEFVNDISNGKNGVRVAQNPIDSCGISNVEPTDCEKLDNNIPPTNNERIICRGEEYQWSGFVWLPTKPTINGDTGGGTEGDSGGGGIITGGPNENLDVGGSRGSDRFGGL